MASEQDADLEHTDTDFSVTTGNKQEKDAQPDRTEMKTSPWNVQHLQQWAVHDRKCVSMHCSWQSYDVRSGLLQQPMPSELKLSSGAIVHTIGETQTF